MAIAYIDPNNKGGYLIAATRIDVQAIIDHAIASKQGCTDFLVQVDQVFTNYMRFQNELQNVPQCVDKWFFAPEQEKNIIASLQCTYLISRQAFTSILFSMATDTGSLSLIDKAVAMLVHNYIIEDTIAIKF